MRWRTTLSGYGAEVEEMEGVWVTSYEGLRRRVEDGDAPLHRYRRREGDRENATAPYLHDLREMGEVDCFVGPG